MKCTVCGAPDAEQVYYWQWFCATCQMMAKAIEGV